MKKIVEPILEKADPHPLDYKELTFKDFIIIQNCSQEVADNIGHPVYLVGSALTKHTPRDIDLAIIIPHEEYMEKYGFAECEHRAAACLQVAFYSEFENIKPLARLVFDDYKIDLKICPDNWFIEKEKIVLATPRRKK